MISDRTRFKYLFNKIKIINLIHIFNFSCENILNFLKFGKHEKKCYFLKDLL